MSFFGSGNNRNILFYGPDSSLHGKVCDSYHKMFKEYKDRRLVDLVGVFGGVLMILVLFAVHNPRHISIVYPLTIFGSFALVFGVLPICILLAIANSKEKKVMTGSYQLATVNLIDVYMRRHNRKNGRTYYIVVSNESGARETVIVPKRNYDIASRYIGRNVGLVKIANGKGMYDDFDYCPGIFEATY